MTTDAGEEKRAVHCWEPGPEAEDGCSTTCMLLDNHNGSHKWTRDDEIRIRFSSIPIVEEPTNG
mgnify:CR=1 FL=1